MRKTIFSMEVFPPKIENGIEHIYNCLEELSGLSPDFISVTYSAGNATAGLTDEVCSYIQNKYNVRAVAHLTCTGATEESIKKELENLRRRDIKSILALRGDITANKQLGIYRHATDLVQVINEFGGFEVCGSCYPEGHMESKSVLDDVKVMKKKHDLGVKHFISQLFFDNNDFINMCDLARKEGVTGTIEAGIMPITRANQIVRMVSLSGAKIIDEVKIMLDKYEFDNDGMRKAGIEFACKQIKELVESGVNGIHLYTMDNAALTKEIYENIKGIL